MACNQRDVSWQVSWQVGKTMGQRNEYMLVNEIATDVVFKVSPTPQDDPGTIRAHKYMLISASHVFSSMFMGGLQEPGDVIVTDIEPETFMEMLRFIYSDGCNLTGHNVMHVLHAAKKYQLPELVRYCAAFLEKELTPAIACSSLEQSRFFNEPEMVAVCMKKIEENASEAFGSHDFMTISRDTLLFILDSDRLGLEEIKIFEACCKWATNHVTDKTSLREALGDILYKIRLPTIPPKQFLEDVCKTGILIDAEQLQILKYTASPETAEKPRDFCCAIRYSGINENRRDGPFGGTWGGDQFTIIANRGANIRSFQVLGSASGNHTAGIPLTLNGFDLYFSDDYSSRVYNNPQQAVLFPPTQLLNKEMITKVEVYTEYSYCYGVEVVEGLIFSSNLGNVFGPYGKVTASKSVSSGSKLIGLFGRCGHALNALGFIWDD